MSQDSQQNNFEEAIKGHDLEDLERILLVNDRKNLNPLFHSAVIKAIKQKKRHPITFIIYNRDFLVAMTALIVSIIALLRD